MSLESGANVYRWRRGIWECRHHDNSVERMEPKDLGNIRGKLEGDWCVHWLKTGWATYIPASDMTETGTLWRWSASKQSWRPIYRRSSGSSTLPEYLVGFVGEPGEVVVEAGEDSLATIYDRTGQAFEVEVQIVAMVDETTSKSSSVLDVADVNLLGVPAAENQRSEERNDTETEALARYGDGVISVRKNLAGVMQEWARWKPGDPVPLNLARALLKAIEEACPSPTPGTTAINDYTALVNDMVVADLEIEDGLIQATGIEDDGSVPSSNHRGAENIEVCKIVGEALAGCGAIADYVQQLRALVRAEDHAPGTATGRRQFEGELNTAAATGMLDAPKIVANLFGATDKLITAVDKASQAAAATNAVAQGVPFVSTVVGALVCARHCRKAYRAGRRWWAYRQMLIENGQQPFCEELQQCLRYAVGKAGRRLRTQAATATTAAVSGTAGGILAVTAVVGGANCWNPVGWVLLGTAAVAGTGIVGYKVYKRVTRTKRHRKREDKYGGIKTPEDLAQRLLSIAGRNDRSRDAAAAKAMLLSFGIAPGELGKPGVEKASMAMVKRHFSG